MTGSGVPPPERPDRKPVQLQISGTAHDDLTRIKAIMSGDVGRRLTFSEVVERLIEHWENT